MGAVTVPWSAALAERARTERWAWDPTTRSWTAPQNLWDPHKTCGNGAGFSRAGDYEQGVRLALGLVGTLRPYQHAAVDYAASHGWRTLFAAEPGLGKTAMALATAEEAGAWPLIVVAPTIVEVHWWREAARWLPARKATILRGERPHPLKGRADIYIVGYPVIARWVTAIARMAPAALVADESHRLGNPSTAMTRSVAALARFVEPASPALALSGTPIANRLAELASTITVLDRWQQIGGRTRWHRRYVALEGIDPADQDAVRARRAEHARLLTDTMMVRYRKADVAKDLPPKLPRVALVVEGDPTVMADYRAAEADVTGWLADQARAAGTNDPAVLVTYVKATSGSEAFRRIGVLRHLAGLAKIHAVLDVAWDRRQTGTTTTIYAYHRDIIDRYARTLGAPTIIGGQNRNARQRIIDQFQAGHHEMLVAGIRAAGIGIDLTAAADCITAELDWNPAAHTQCEDRHNRHGSTAPLTHTMVLADRTTDLWMYGSILGGKADEIDHSIDGRPVDHFDLPDTDGLSPYDTVLTRLAERAVTATR